MGCAFAAQSGSKALHGMSELLRALAIAGGETNKEPEVCYPWHPLFGRVLRVYLEAFGGENVGRRVLAGRCFPRRFARRPFACLRGCFAIIGHGG